MYDEYDEYPIYPTLYAVYYSTHHHPILTIFYSIRIDFQVLYKLQGLPSREELKDCEGAETSVLTCMPLF